MKVNLLTEPKPGAKHNEDLFGYHGNTVWLFDGATSLDGPPLAHDAFWLVHQLNAQFSQLAFLNLPLPEMAAIAQREVAKRYPADAERCPRAALALLRWHPNRLELALTGNITVWICRDDAVADWMHREDVVTEYRDTRVAPGHETKDDELLAACRAGMSFEDPAFKALRRKMRDTETQLYRAASDWLLAPRERPAEQFVCIEHALAGGEQVLMATDGFVDLQQYLKLKTSSFLSYVCTNWSPMLLHHLRMFETLPNSAQRMPRTKRHDDATVAWLSQ